MASSASRRKTILGALVGVLLVAVVIDRAGLLRSGADDGAPVDSRMAMYRSSAATLERQKRLIDRSEAWEAAADRAQDEWSELESRIVNAQTLDLAEEDLQERIASELDSFGMSVASRQPVSPELAEEEQLLRPIEVRIEFAADNPDKVYAFIDHIENLPDLLLNVRRVELRGPGMKGIPHQVDATLWIRALALVEETS